MTSALPSALPTAVRTELEFEFGELTLETPAPGLRVLQPRRGHRYGVEVYALAGFALGIGCREVPAEFAVEIGAELGAGSGVVSLLLASRGVSMTALELDPAWVRLATASRDLCAPDIRDRVTVEERDIRTIGAQDEEFAVDVVVANPPWFDPAAGPSSPDPRRAAARTMLSGRVCDFVDAALRIAPRVCIATRIERHPELMRPGSHIARWARLGRNVVLAEIRPGEGTLREEILDLPAIYLEFRGEEARGPHS